MRGERGGLREEKQERNVSCQGEGGNVGREVTFEMGEPERIN